MVISEMSFFPSRLIKLSFNTILVYLTLLSILLPFNIYPPILLNMLNINHAPASMFDN